MLTRSIVFTSVLFIFLAATGMTIAAIIIPNWLSYDSYHVRLHISYRDNSLQC